MQRQPFTPEHVRRTLRERQAPDFSFAFDILSHLIPAVRFCDKQRRDVGAPIHGYDRPAIHTVPADLACVIPIRPAASKNAVDLITQDVP